MVHMPGPGGRVEEVPTHALGRQISRINDVFDMIGSHIEVRLKVVSNGKRAPGRPRFSATTRRSRATARAARVAKYARIAKARKSKGRAVKD